MAKAKKPDFVIRKSGWSVAKIRYVLPFLLSIIFAIVVFCMYNWDFATIPMPMIIAVCAAFGVSLIPLIVWWIRAINVWDETISFYGNKVVHRTGIFRKDEHTNILTHVLSVSVKQSFWQRVFRFGTITIEVMGPWDIDLSGVKNIKKAKAYLESIAVNGMDMSHVIMN